MRLVIVGGGIMGVGTAYYANKIALEKGEDLEVIIVDQSGIARAASGKAGGFLARNWATGALKPLAEKGFLMYPDLCEELGGAAGVQYRTINAVSGKVVRDKKPAPRGLTALKRQPNNHRQEKRRDIFNNVFDRDKILPGQMLGNEQTTAQVTPWFLVNKMFEASGAKFIKAELVGVKFQHSNNNKITAITIKREEQIDVDGEMKKRVIFEDIHGDEFCFCLGVYTEDLRKMKLRAPKSMGRMIHAVILKPREELTLGLSYMNMGIFTDFNNTEIIIREKGICYVNGSEKNYEKVHLKPEEIIPDKKACKKILGFWEYLTAKPKHGHHPVLMDVSEHVDNHETDPKSSTHVISTVACHLPMVKHEYKGEKLPVMCKIPKTSNAYVCAGHTCWGILLGPLSGHIMAEMIINKDPNKIVDTTPFQMKMKPRNPQKKKSSMRQHKGENISVGPSTLKSKSKSSVGTMPSHATEIGDY